MKLIILLLLSVAAFGQKPIVSITSPPASSTMTAPATFTFSAKATTSTTRADGYGIKSVRFYDGPILLFTELNAPYGGTTILKTVGEHTLRIVATSNTGETTSTSRKIQVTAPDVQPSPDAPASLEELAVQLRALKTMVADSFARNKPADFVVGESPAGVCDGVNRTFELSGKALAPASITVHLFSGGIAGQRVSARAYVVDNSGIRTKIVFRAAPPAGNSLEVDYLK